MRSDTARFNRFFHAMLERGVYLAPSAFEAGFMSAAHGERDIADTIDAAREAFARSPTGGIGMTCAETIAIHAGGEPDAATGAVAPPIQLATTFRMGRPASARPATNTRANRIRPRTGSRPRWLRSRAAARRWPSPRAWQRNTPG